MHKGDLGRGMLKRRPTLDITRSNWYQVHAQVDKVGSHFIQSARDHIAELYDLHRFESDTERLEFIDSLLADNKYLFPVAERVEGGIHGPNPTQRVSKAANEWPTSTLLPARCNPGCSYFKFYPRGNDRSKYADGYYNSVIDDKDSYIPSAPIMFTYTALRHAPLDWQKNKGVHLKASKFKLKADRPDRSNYINYKNDGGKIPSCWAAKGPKLLTSPGIVDRYTILMNTWNTLPESCQ
jgi:hypothetical protein